CATQNMDENATIEFKQETNKFNILIKGYAGKLDDSLPMKKWIIPFKLFCKTILRFNNFSYWFNASLKRNKIAKQNKIPVLMNRKIALATDKIELTDTLEVISSSLKFNKVKHVRDVTTIHSPSSRFYQIQYLIPDCKTEIVGQSHQKYIFKHNII
ncbi:MAG: hypothetical protein K8R68_06110, partial [Bacteroidales bacterium]|nr:hypothetical protein [Bacteroidales bacterium]